MVLRRAATSFRVGLTRPPEGPFGYGVGNGARDVKGGESVQALHAARGPLANAADARPVAGAVLVVDPLYDGLAGRFAGFPDAAGGLYSGDGGDEAGTGDPEGRRHLA